MAIQSIIKREQRFVHTTCTGLITFQEILEYLEDIWVNGNVDGFHELFDALKADFSSLSMSDVFEISKQATFIDKSPRGSKLAFVINSDAQAEMADFYRSMRQSNVSSHRDIQLFYQIHEALNWVFDSNPTNENKSEPTTEFIS